MIPIRLSLKNFMSYGSEPAVLDFSGMHVACLSGDNGNGKSALLDAMTFALWGKTRASGSQAGGDDFLIRLAAEELEVQFDFLLAEDLFRVIRRRRRSHPSEWSVLLSDKAGGWKPVGGSTSRETERYLQRLLRVEYETFLNSAYVQQGRADEFARQRPDARKRILAEILELNRYDELEEMAKKRKTESDLVVKDMDGEIRMLDAVVAREQEYRASLETAEVALKRWTEEQKRLSGELLKIRKQLAALDEAAGQLKERESRIAAETEMLNRVESSIREAEKRITDCKAILADRERIQAEFKALGDLRSAREHLDKDVASLRVAKSARGEADLRLKLRKHELESELKTCEMEWRQAEESLLQVKSASESLADLQIKLAGGESLEREMKETREKQAAIQKQFTALKAKNEQIKADREELEEVIKALAGPSPFCPTCETDLSAGRKEQVIGRQKAKLASLLAEHEKIKRDGVECNKAKDEITARIDALALKENELRQIRARFEEQQRALELHKKTSTKAPEVKSRLESVRLRLDKSDFGAEERGEIAKLDSEIRELEPRSVQHEAATHAIRRLETAGIESQHARLSDAGSNLSRLEEEPTRRTEEKNQISLRIKDELSKRDALAKGLAEHRTTQNSVITAERELAEAECERDMASGQTARCKKGIEDCAKAKKEAGGKQKERESALKDRQAYTELAAAFSRKGIQALIIHNVLPDIEEEANRLLARMTDHAMKVTLDTQRSSKSGTGQIETLDIRITDDAGERPYELFSGGEAFRVNFALRIALSRLLTRRAGARLQTLIIDEGFGTQDAKGRERLVEAIESVRDEFALILVITHVEDLKDAFQTRIEITKGPAGSQILQ